MHWIEGSGKVNGVAERRRRRLGIDQHSQRVVQSVCGKPA